MALQRDTVAIPVAKGIDVNTPARLVDAQELLEAQNVRFTAKAGARKRRGHLGQRIRGAKALPAAWTPPVFAKPTRTATYFTGERNLSSQWLYGYGYTPVGYTVDPSVALQTSDYPESGYAFGATQRDNESLVWDGFRLLSRTSLDLPGGQFSEVPAVLPALHSEPFAKANIAQQSPDVADNGTIRVATWVSGSKAYYSVFDSQQGALITTGQLPTINGAVAVRAIPVGPWVHILVADNDAQKLQLRSIHRSTPYSVSSASYGECSGYFDVWKVNEGSFLVAQADLSGNITVRVATFDGTLATNWSPVAGGVKAVSICLHPVTQNVCLAWRTSFQVKAATYLLDGTPITGTRVITGTAASATRAVTVAPKWLQTGSNAELFNVYYDDYSSISSINIARFNGQSGAVEYSASKFHLLVGSQAFRVGDRTFVWAARNSTYQSSWILLDESLNSVGRAEFATANTPSGSSIAYTNFSINWTGDALAQHRCVFHCALSTRVRVPVEPKTAGVNPPAVYSEPYIKFTTLDFLPPLRAAQAGRSTYFAGAQLWSYDGAELTEANFLLAPEGVTAVGSGAGSLTASGQYIWRVDLCYRNAQNEEIRSASFYTDGITLPGGVTAAQLTIPSVLTRRSNAYFLIYRNENHGTVWYLCNSRDPASALFLKNDQSVSQVTYLDSTVTDAALITREQHPNQSFTHLDPFAAPAAEVIAAGRDRLWLAGGEIAPGEVYPSRLFAPGEVPAFHGDLAIDVDRSAEPITAVGFVGDFTVFFRQTHNYILDNSGPDNEGTGDWNVPRRSDSDIGPISQESVCHIPGGVVFHSPAGIRQFTPGGGVNQFGAPIDKLAATLTITSAVVIPEDQEVRFYTWEGTTLVFNYGYGSWSTWTVSAAGAIRDPQTGLAVVVTPTGTLLREAEDVWTDDSKPYKMRVRFSWLRAGNLLDFQQVRRIGAVGEALSNHSIHVDVYYNEREFAEEWFDWNYPDVQDTFGSLTFGAGNFGDDAAVPAIQLHDSTWAWRRRLHRRKCSVISIAIDDNYTNGEGFCLTALALELAKKPGLDRTPWRGGTFTNTGGSGSSGTGE